MAQTISWKILAGKEVGFKEGLVNVSSRPPGPDTGVPGIAQVLSYADLCGLRQSLVNMCVSRTEECLCVLIVFVCCRVGGMGGG